MFNAENLARVAELLYPDIISMEENYRKKPVKIQNKIRLTLYFLFPKSEFADPLGPWDLM